MVTLVGITLLAFVGSAIAVRASLWLLVNNGVFDHPGSRASHAFPTPRGGGVALVLVLAALWWLVALWWQDAPGETSWIVACGLALAVPSLADDLVGLPAMPRFIWQIMVTGIGTALLWGEGAILSTPLPASLVAFGTLFVWVGFINLYNFADGIDGNAGTKAVAIGLGVFLVGLSCDIPSSLGAIGITTAAAALGFLVWNWHPARLFMGDVGSVPIGFLLAWLLFRLASYGQWAPAVILPLAYVSDTGATYAVKLARREHFWLPHRDHFYQRAAGGVYTHAEVVRAIAVADVVLIGWAVLAARGLIWPALVGATLTSVTLIRYLRHMGRSQVAP